MTMEPFTGLLLLVAVFIVISAIVEAMREAMRKLGGALGNLIAFLVGLLCSLIAMIHRVVIRAVANMRKVFLVSVPTGLTRARSFFLSMRYWPVPDKLAVCAFLSLILACLIVWIEFGGLSAYMIVSVTILSPVPWILFRSSTWAAGTLQSPQGIKSASDRLHPDYCNPVFDAESQPQNGHYNGPGLGRSVNRTGGANSYDKKVDESEERRIVKALRHMLSKRRLSGDDRDTCKRLIDRLSKTLKYKRETVESLRALLNEFQARIALRNRLTHHLCASITHLERLPRADKAGTQSSARVPQGSQSRYAAVDDLLDIIENPSSSEAACLRATRELGEQRYFSEKHLDRLSEIYEAILGDAGFSREIADALGDALIQMEGKLESFRYTAKRPS